MAGKERKGKENGRADEVHYWSHLVHAKELFLILLILILLIRILLILILILCNGQKFGIDTEDREFSL